MARRGLENGRDPGRELLDRLPVLAANERAASVSADAAYTRVTAAQACRRFPQLFDLLAAGTLTLTSVRLIGPHLTAENHQDVIARAAHRSVAEVKRLVAELAPQPDARSLVRKLPAPAAAPETRTSAVAFHAEAPLPARESAPTAPEIALSASAARSRAGTRA